MKNPKVAAAVKNAIAAVSIILLALEGILLLLPVATGCKAFAVLTNSMSPTLRYGTLVFVQKVDFNEVKVNDIATFQSQKDQDKIFTHRIVKIDVEKQAFTTKGDANPVEDAVDIGYSQMVGKVVAIVPFAGIVTAALSNIYMAAVIILLLVVWLAVEIELWRGKKTKKKARDDG